MIQGPHGGVITESRHEVKTLDAARKWYPEVKEYQLPLKVHVYKSSNGRTYVDLLDSCKNNLFTKG